MSVKTRMRKVRGLLEVLEGVVRLGKEVEESKFHALNLNWGVRGWGVGRAGGSWW